MEPFFRLVHSPTKFRLYLLTNLPSAFFSGLRIKHANAEECVVTIPYRWFTRNPFGSTYFACLSMAAEMSTGILAMAHVYQREPKISMLVINMEAAFTKKASGNTNFRCEDGLAIKEAVEKSIATGEGQTVRVRSVGTNAQNETVAEFFITWSFKVKSKG